MRHYEELFVTNETDFCFWLVNDVVLVFGLFFIISYYFSYLVLSNLFFHIF
jgi:hypothetical protein